MSPAFDTGCAGRRDRANRSRPIIHASRGSARSWQHAAGRAPGKCDSAVRPSQRHRGARLTLSLPGSGRRTDIRRRSPCQGSGSTTRSPSRYQRWLSHYGLRGIPCAPWRAASQVEPRARRRRCGGLSPSSAGSIVTVAVLAYPLCLLAAVRRTTDPDDAHPARWWVNTPPGARREHQRRARLHAEQRS